MKSRTDSNLTGTPAGLPRRLGAIFYDTLLLLAVLFFATLLVLPFNDGNAVAANNPLFKTYLFFVSFFFFGWFWTHGGQTLGMRAWKIRVQCFDGGNISWRHALLRFIVAIPSWALAGMGFIWILFDKNSLAWHDRYSETVVVQLTNPPQRQQANTEK